MSETGKHKVIDFFSGKPLDDLEQERIIRLAPENDGLCILYSNDNNPERFYTMKIMGWALRWNGDVVGMVPWLGKLMPCTEIKDPLNGCWEGYYDPGIDNIFYDAPMHKVVELETALAYFETHLIEDKEAIIQDVPDNIGTHALLMADDSKTLFLTEVLCWRLYNNGHITGMLVDPDRITSTPVLMGDDCLYPADDNPQFRYYFQYHIANQIKNHDPEAMEAIKLLFNNKDLTRP